MNLKNIFKPDIHKKIRQKNIPGLIKCTRKEKWPDVQERAVKALGRFRDSRATKPLLDLVTDVSTGSWQSISWSLHFSAIVALGEIGDKEGIALLLWLLEKGNDHYRSAAVTGLGYSRATPEVITALSKSMYDYRAYIILASIRDSRVIKPMINMLTTQYSSADVILTVYPEAERGLVTIGSLAVKPLIETLEMEKNSKKKARIINILQEITGQNFGNDLNAWKAWLVNIT